MTVFTGNVFGAGTDANVYIVFVGEIGESGHNTTGLLSLLGTALQALEAQIQRTDLTYSRLIMCCYFSSCVGLVRSRLIVPQIDEQFSLILNTYTKRLCGRFVGEANISMDVDRHKN